MVLISASMVIILFFPEMLQPSAGDQSEATTGIFAMDTYITMTAYGRNAETALSDAEDRLVKLEQLWSVTDGALEPTIYPVLTAWGFTTEENRVPSDAEITELLKNVGYERIRLEDAVESAGVRVERLQLDGRPHGFGIPCHAADANRLIPLLE